MQLGFVSAILPDLGLEEVMQCAADSGFDCVEVMCWPKGPAERRYAGVTHIDVAGFDAATAERVQALTRRTGVSISALGYYPNPLAPDPAEREVSHTHLRAVIDAARLLGLTSVNTFVGRDPAWPMLVVALDDHPIVRGECDDDHIVRHLDGEEIVHDAPIGELYVFRP